MMLRLPLTNTDILHIYTVATYPKVKNCLTFQWPLNSFHWPFTDEKQSMSTFALVLFAGHTYFSLHFQPLSAFRGRRKKEYGRKHSQRKPLTTITTCVRLRVSNWSLCLLCSILFIFSGRKCISKSWRRLMNYKPENRIPWPFTDFDNTKNFPRLFKKFPDLEKCSFYPDFSLTVATMI